MIKLGTIAGVLSKPEEDLKSSYKLEGDEVTPELLESILKAEIPALKKAAYTEAKSEAYGRATREIKSNVEKQLAEKFGLPVSDLDTLVSELESKVKSDDPKKEEQKVKELELWKQKFNSLNADFQRFKEQVEYQSKKSKVVYELDKVIPNYFDISSPKLKELAFEKFVNDFKFDLIDGQLQLFEGDKPLYKPIDEVAKDYFKDFFPVKQSNSSKPSVPQGQNDPKASGINTNDVSELMRMLNLSRSSKERAEILAKIKELSK